MSSTEKAQGVGLSEDSAINLCIILQNNACVVIADLYGQELCAFNALNAI